MARAQNTAGAQRVVVQATTLPPCLICVSSQGSTCPPPHPPGPELKRDRGGWPGGAQSLCFPSSDVGDEGPFQLGQPWGLTSSVSRAPTKPWDPRGVVAKCMDSE